MRCQISFEIIIENVLMSIWCGDFSGGTWQRLAKTVHVRDMSRETKTTVNALQQLKGQFLCLTLTLLGAETPYD